MLWRQSGREKAYGKDTSEEVLVPVQETREGRVRARGQVQTQMPLASVR